MKKKGELWSTMSEADKIPYVKLSNIDQERYDQEVKQLRTYGFFIDKNGVKSTDMKKKVKLSDQRAIKEKAADIIEKAVVLAKLDSAKSGFEVFKALKYVTLCNKLQGATVKDQHV